MIIKQKNLTGRKFMLDCQDNLKKAFGILIYKSEKHHYYHILGTFYGNQKFISDVLYKFLNTAETICNK